MEFTIDNRVIDAREGENVLEAARRHGIDIPHFCYHPCLSSAGSCRMCLVKVEGLGKLVPSCNLTVAANMKVQTSAPEVQRARQSVLQFMLLNHPVDCGICDKAGECRLQDYEFEHGAPRSRSLEPKQHKRKLYALSSRIQLDNERCILCSRCVRFTKEISKSNALGIVERGGRSVVDRLSGSALEDPYSDNVIGLCPTGALLSQDFLYKSRVWYLEPVRSVCTGCARGCSVNVWRRKKEWQLHALGDEKNRAIYRVTARDNPDINGPWICNKGFDLHKTAARERGMTPMLGAATATIEQAIAAAKTLLAEAQRPAVLISSQASNEELDALKAALTTMTVARVALYTREDVGPALGEVIEDDLLIRADKNPNSYGVRERFGWLPLDASAPATHDVFLIWGEWPDYSSLGDARLIHLSVQSPRGEIDPDVYIPLSTPFERSGTFTNFAGQLNRFDAVFDKPALVQHAVEVFGRLAA